MAEVVAALLPEVGDIRRVPAALDLAYLACGRFDCAVLAGTKLWDVAAGLLLAREAGVVLGDRRPPHPALILAGAPGLWDGSPATRRSRPSAALPLRFPAPPAETAAAPLVRAPAAARRAIRGPAGRTGRRAPVPRRST